MFFINEMLGKHKAYLCLWCDMCFSNFFSKVKIAEFMTELCTGDHPIGPTNVREHFC